MRNRTPPSLLSTGLTKQIWLVCANSVVSGDTSHKWSEISTERVTTLSLVVVIMICEKPSMLMKVLVLSLLALLGLALIGLVCLTRPGRLAQYLLFKSLSQTRMILIHIYATIAIIAPGECGVTGATAPREDSQSQRGSDGATHPLQPSVENTVRGNLQSRGSVIRATIAKVISLSEKPF